MLVSYRWLQELCPVDADVAEVARRISLAGLEVEAMEEKGHDLRGVVIAEIRAKSPHPKRDKLTLVRVFTACCIIGSLIIHEHTPDPSQVMSPSSVN